MISKLEDLPAFLTPSLKLFLSVDLIGSTKLKHDEDALAGIVDPEQRLSSIGVKWFNHLTEFYSGFQEYFNEEWTKIFEVGGFAKPEWQTSESPTLWKVNGDELIYVLDISHPGQIVAGIHAWKDALLRYRKHLNERNTTLDLKATAWMAGFPIGNHEVAFWSDLSSIAKPGLEHAGKVGHYYRLNQWHNDKKESKQSAYVKDYIGPSVDTGFRLAAFSSARRFPVSIEVAYFLSHFPFGTDENKHLALNYHGRESMKGVLSGMPYPIFWIDTVCETDVLTHAEDELFDPTNKHEAAKIKKYVSLFFSDAKNKLFKPFIYGCPDPDFCMMPENYGSRLSTISKVWEKELKKLEIAGSPNFEDDEDSIVLEATSEELDMLKIRT